MIDSKARRTPGCLSNACIASSDTGVQQNPEHSGNSQSPRDIQLLEGAVMRTEPTDPFERYPSLSDDPLRRVTGDYLAWFARPVLIIATIVLFVTMFA